MAEILVSINELFSLGVRDDIMKFRPLNSTQINTLYEPFKDVKHTTREAIVNVMDEYFKTLDCILIQNKYAGCNFDITQVKPIVDDDTADFMNVKILDITKLKNIRYHDFLGVDILKIFKPKEVLMLILEGVLDISSRTDAKGLMEFICEKAMEDMYGDSKD